MSRPTPARIAKRKQQAERRRRRRGERPTETAWPGMRMPAAAVAPILQILTNCSTPVTQPGRGNTTSYDLPPPRTYRPPTNTGR